MTRSTCPPSAPPAGRERREPLLLRRSTGRGAGAAWGSYDLTQLTQVLRGIRDIMTGSRIIDIASDLLGNSAIRPSATMSGSYR